MPIKLQDLTSQLNLDSKGFKAGATAAIAGVTAVVAGMAIALKATQDWANDLDGLGDVMDGTNKDFAALAFVARKSGVGVDKFTKANVLLEKSLLKSNGTLDVSGKKLREYGIHVKDANGNVKNSVQLTDEIAQKFGKLATNQEKVNFLTDIYGKQGAELIDFFDTLNGEGGIAAVTKKVKAFGLAIDPARYEKFNRNLEELKLIGLGLAVSFTERLMPTLENFLGWLSKTAQSPKFKQLKDQINGLFSSVFGGGGSSQFDLKNGTRQKSFSTLLSELLKDMDAGLAQTIDNVNWADHGSSFSKYLEDMLSKGASGADVPKSLSSLASALNNFVGGMFGTDEAGLQGIIKDKLAKIGDTWYGQGIMWGVKLNTAVQLAPSLIATSIMRMDTFIDGKLRLIAKTFFNRATAWAQQMIAGFTGSQSGLFSKIAGMVATINGLLRKIITSFHLTLTFSEPTSTGSTGNRGGGGSTGGGGGGGKKRATAGPVFAGQTYDVAEFNKAERFTPNQSGRVDPVKETRVKVEMDYNKLARALAPVLLKLST